jgi:hypothetical protein
MDEWERLAIHPPGEQYFRTASLVERDRPAKGLGRGGLRANVGTLEADVKGTLQWVGERNYVA